MKVVDTDCLVLGAGLAGAAYAYHIGKQGYGVILLSADKPKKSANSNWAQGGIIYHDKDDMDRLRKDILDANGGTSNPDAVDALLRHGAQSLKSLLLDELEIDFDREESTGDLKFTREGGHSEARIIFAKDTTGKSILDGVHKALDWLDSVTRIENSVAIDLLTLSHSSTSYHDRFKPTTVFGAYVMDTQTREIYAIRAKKTVLATGGLGQLYNHTTNQRGIYGHGAAMAYRVGARMMDMEYIQFHPTAFCKKGAPTFLLTEALRGEGAILINEAGERFMEGKHPLKELAPRDFVARSIYEEMMQNGDFSVYLDMTHFDPDHLKTRFPFVYERCLEFGVDITREPAPVAPAAHYLCGGVYSSMSGRTTIQNLNAIGESACTGLHGANRLASTSLLECLTGAQLTADLDLRDLRNETFHLPEVKQWRSPKKEADSSLVKQDLKLIKNTMTNYVGLIRSADRLERAGRILSTLKEEVDAFYKDCRLDENLLNLRNAVLSALLVVHAAKLNRQSRGCHYRSDAVTQEVQGMVESRI